MKRFFARLTVLLCLSCSIHASTGFVTNQDNDTVSVVDSATGQITATIPVGTSPQALALSSDKSTLYVANTGSNTISVIDTTTFQVIQTLNPATLSSPDSLALDPKGRYLAIGNLGSNNLEILHLQNDPITGTSLPLGFAVGPRSMTVTPNGSLIYIADNTGNTVTAVNMADPINPTILETITVGNSPSSVAVSPNTRFAAVSNKTDNTVSIISTFNNVVVSTVTVGSSPSSVSFNSTSDKVYVTNSGDNTASTITLNTSMAISTGIRPTQVVVAPDGNKVYVINTGPFNPNTANSSVTVIDAKTFQVLATVEVGETPVGIALTSDSSKAYVANRGSNTVSAIDTTTYAVTEITVAASPAGIATQGSEVLVTSTASNSLSFIDTITDTVVASINTSSFPALGSIARPTTIFAHPTNGFAYVLNLYNEGELLPPVFPRLAIIHSASRAVVGEIELGNIVGRMNWSRDGSTIFINNQTNSLFFGTPLDSTLNIISTTTNMLIDTPIIGPFSTSTTSNSTGDYIYVANGEIASINANANTIFVSVRDGNTFDTKLVLGDRNPRFMDITPNNEVLYMVSRNQDNLIAFSVNAEGILLPVFPQTVDVGFDPWRLAFSPDSSFAFVTNRGDWTVSAILTDPTPPNPIAAALYNTAVPILNSTSVTTTTTDVDPEVIKPDEPNVPEEPPITPGIPPSDDTPTPEPTPIPDVPEVPPPPVCSCADTVWIVNSANNTITIRREDGSYTTTVFGFSNPSDIVISLQKTFLLHTVFHYEVIENNWCSERFANLQWSGFPGALEYKLYQNDEFLASFGPEVHSYQDHNLEFDVNYNYTLYICTENGALRAYQFNLIDSF